MWWVSPSMALKKPETASLTAALPTAGSALPNRKMTSSVRWATNLSGSKASMSAKMAGMLRLIWVAPVCASR